MNVKQQRQAKVRKNRKEISLLQIKTDLCAKCYKLIYFNLFIIDFLMALSYRGAECKFGNC